MNNTGQPFLFPKLLSFSEFSFKNEKLSNTQTGIFASVIVIFIALKIYLIQLNFIGSGASALGVWDAFKWSQRPFFVMPDSGFPLWYYFMGPLLKITGEVYLTSAYAMIALMIIACIYIFKLTFILTDFKTALLAFIISTLNPVTFRLNFEPGPQQIYLAAVCIMIYYFIKALGSDKSVTYFIISGIFSFLALASSPEAFLVILPMCLLAFLTRKNGCCYYIGLSILFPLIWAALSYSAFGDPFISYRPVLKNLYSFSIPGSDPGLRLHGFFLPYYYIVIGLTIIIFYYFAKGIIVVFKSYPKVFLIALLIPLLATALANGIAAIFSTYFNTTQYLYLMFLIAPFFAAAGLNSDLLKIRSGILQIAFASVVILSCIPLSYINKFAPESYKHFFPRDTELIVTLSEPEETRKLIEFIDNNIKQYPALIFDADDNNKDLYFIPYRTNLVPSGNIIISGLNTPADKDGLTAEIKAFLKRNRKGIIMYRKNANTVINRIFTELTAPRHYKRNDMTKVMESDKWIVYIYQPPEELK